MRLIGDWSCAGSAATWVAAAEAQDGGTRALLSVTERPGGWTGRVEADGLMLPVSCSGWSTREGAQAWCEHTAADRLGRPGGGQAELSAGVQEAGR